MNFFFRQRTFPDMGKYGQLVCGPAGAGKSTYCEVIQKHCENGKRTVHVVNLDPAAEAFNYEVAFGKISPLKFDLY